MLKGFTRNFILLLPWTGKMEGAPSQNKNVSSQRKLMNWVWAALSRPAVGGGGRGNGGDGGSGGGAGSSGNDGNGSDGLLHAVSVFVSANI